MEKMTFEHAQRLFGIAANHNPEELQLQYHKLLKKYHPDNYRDNIEFYTIMTSRINQAYQLLTHHLGQGDDKNNNERYAPSSSSTSSAPSMEERDAKNIDMAHDALEKDTEAQTASAPSEYNLLKGMHKRYPLCIASEYQPYIRAMSEAICHYYSYNLSNVYLRDEGTTHTHFSIGIEGLRNIRGSKAGSRIKSYSIGTRLELCHIQQM